MYLSKLELQGFKSFNQKTTVHFDSGITAVVGPNGCGKSNIVDAIRWCLGEQRPTLLRSASMTNVIFNGTANRKAQGMAEVSLTINNNRAVLPTEFTDVTITRRLYRSGESEYLLNKSPCRLKDIIDLFMDTGMGANAYSVIELKMVEEILNDKNNDRRLLFEEAAGITKYKERRKQTLKKLQDTRGDMQRVEDILVEVRKKNRSLEIQANKAERARQHEAELRHLDLAVSRKEYETIQNELEPLQERIVNATTEKEELTRKISELEENHKRAEESLVEKERKQNEAQKHVNDLANRIRDLKTEIQIKDEKIKNERGVISQFETDISQSDDEIKELRKAAKESREALEKSQKELEKVAGELQQAEADYRKLDEEVKNERSRLEETNSRYEETNKAINELQSRRIRIESKLENSKEERKRISREIEQNSKKINEFEERREHFDASWEQARQHLEQAEKERDEASGRRDELLERQNSIKDDIRKLESKRDALESEKALLENISESNEAFPESVRFLKSYKDRFNRLEILSDLLTTSDEYAVALESVLGEACNFVVVENFEEAEQAAQLLSENEKGTATLIPIDRLSNDYPVHDKALYHHVDCDPDYEPLKKLFLGEVMLIDDLEQAGKTSPGKHRAMVTRNGDVLRREGFLNSGSRHKNVGMRVGLQDKINNLAYQCEQIDVQIEESQQQLADITREYEEIDLQAHTRAVQQASEQLQQLEKEKNSTDAQKQVYENTIQDLKTRDQNLEQEIETAEKELGEIDPESTRLQEKLEELVREQMEIKSSLQKKEESRQRLQDKYNEIKLRHQNLSNQVDNHTRDAERSEEGVESVKKRLEQRAENARQSKDNILQYQQDIEQAKEDLGRLEEEKKQADEQLQQAEEECSQQRGHINSVESELKEVRRKKENNTELLHSLDKAKSQYDLEAKNISDHIWENYEMMIDQIEEQLPEDTDPESAKQRISDLKQRLRNIGTVNPMAIEEFEEEKKRLEHFEQQLSDLENAEQQLKDTINEINETAQQRFDETFENIRTNFQTVFNTLFGGNDHCDLKIDENAEDPLDARINIIANPRGKRPNIIEQLSGGEKTLTAIALLFAIYLVKPSPFCILDEVDAPLDDANVERFTRLLREFSEDTQFIVITHNKKTMEKSEMMYGVTMPEAGVSKLVGVRMDEVEEQAE